MRFLENSNLISCAIIKVESNEDYHFKVTPENIMDAEYLIVDVFDKFNIPHKRIYPTGFQLVTKSEIYSLEKLSEALLRIAKQHITKCENTKIAKR